MEVLAKQGHVEMAEKRVAKTSADTLEESDTLEQLASKIRKEALLPAKSLARYEEAWAQFLSWKDSKYSTESMDENALLVYLDSLKDRFAPSSLWTVFSMLKRQYMVNKSTFYFNHSFSFSFSLFLLCISLPFFIFSLFSIFPLFLSFSLFSCYSAH
jgi:hypothetical protein